MKKFKTALCLFFAMVMTFTVLPVNATNTTTSSEVTYSEYEKAILFQPGGNESERNVSWYSPIDAGDSRVEVSTNSKFTGVVTVYPATSIKTPQGDRSNKVTISKLEPNTTYYYRCCDNDNQSKVYSFKTSKDNNFSAMYVTDIHISDESETSIKDQSQRYADVIKTANSKKELSLIISGGDQASYGLRSEYTGLVSSDLAKSVPIALTIGNHDTKNGDFRFFSNNPNESKDMKIQKYNGGDYWFVKGNALFLCIDSNNTSAGDHKNFMQKAIEQNPDVKWRVAVFHHDLYGGRIPHRESENVLYRAILTPLIDHFNIDLVLTGHSHYYTVSNVVYNRKSVESVTKGTTVTDPKGTVFMVSGSINRPRSVTPGEELPVGKNIGFYVTTEDVLYNIIDFSDESITVNSYSYTSGEKFNTYSIVKTSQQGGHKDTKLPFYYPFVEFAGGVYTVFNNIGRAYDMINLGIKMTLSEILFGK